ncbi:MAG: hypothetical protein J6Y92_11400 [Lentisphaeria bacterium]|nr:hypothetical protein [Lentisphaeria bacterium]
MFQSLRQLAERTGSIIAERPFAWGVLAGLAAALVLLLVFLLLGLISRSRKLRRIVIPSEGGELRIDAKAVQGAVRSVAENFPAFVVRRVTLYGKQDAVDLEVAMDFRGGDADVSLSDLSVRFRAAVARMMTETFGMEKPARIELEILRSVASIPDSAAESEPAGKPAEPVPDSESGPSC